jgi:hypothetical protein
VTAERGAHTIIFRAKWDRAAALLEEAGTRDYRKMVSTTRGIRAITGWIIGNGIPEQFNLNRPGQNERDRGVGVEGGG